MNLIRTPEQKRAIDIAKANVAAAQTELSHAQAALDEAWEACLPVKVGDVVLGGKNKLEYKIMRFHAAEYGWLRCVLRRRDGTWGRVEHCVFDWEKPE